MNKKILFNDHWQFAKTDIEVEQVDKKLYEPVELPHDWLIYNTNKLYEDSIGWYRKLINYQPSDEEILIEFDAVYMDSSLYLNGKFVGEWKYGYSTFEMNISDYLIEGENEILLKVVHQSPNSRWYTGAGIYRNVWLKTRGKNYIETNGIYISTKKLKDYWQISLESELKLSNNAYLIHKIFDKDKELQSVSKNIQASGQYKQRMKIKNPKLWSPSTPNLYQLRTELWIKNDKGQKFLGESVSNPLGFRTIELNTNQGFILNGKRIEIKGTCEHHDLGALGAVANPVAIRRRLTILKEMGVNGIRTSHNMPSKEFMHLADEMGFLIVSESFDMWERPKTEYDYARFFKDWAYKDIESWVKRDRNHPSLIMWTLGNEIYDTHADSRGIELTQLLKEHVLEFDPNRNAYITIASNYLPWENAQKSANLVDVVGYNYGDKYYKEHRSKFPDWVIYGSETAAVVQSRGIYHFPYEKAILSDDNQQCSALGNSSTSWGSDSPEASIIAERDNPFSLGQFIWTGFDYIGEPTPYHTKNSYFGQIDTATFKKDSYYIYQANWTDYKKTPMIHLFPYWDFNPGQLIDVRVATNAPKFELFLNDQLVVSRKINHEKDFELIPTFKIPFEKGTIKAIAYDEFNQVIASDVNHSFGNPHSLELTADKKQLIAGSNDLIFVEIKVNDKKEHPVENASNRIEVEVSGAGRLVGLDNGDSTDYDQYKGISKRLFNGKLMAIIAANEKSGDIHVTARSKGLKDYQLKLEAIEKKFDHFYLTPLKSDFLNENKEYPIVNGSKEEIPVRKLEILTDSGQKLTNDQPIKNLAVKLYPEEASYQEVNWSVVDDLGVPANNAKIESFGQKAKLTAIGDGSFRVRCTSNNGTDHITIISELEMTASGLGPVYKNPYNFISASLYDYSAGELTSGNERGVATSRDGTTTIGYEQVDFGKIGSDTITLPIFALDDAEHRIEIWDGMPNVETSQLIKKISYQKESIWNVYQSETYYLPERLKGLCSIYFVFNDKVHLKGFSFDKKTIANEKILAKNADFIYGDSFTVKKENVENIGNNVSLIFESLNFGKNGIQQILINGRSLKDKNTIHIRINDGAQSKNQIIEFTQTEDYETQSFHLDKINGVNNLSFIFLPGSQFDFKWFKFK